MEAVFERLELVVVQQGERTLVGYNTSVNAEFVDRNHVSLRPTMPPVIKDKLFAPMPVASNSETMQMAVFVDGRVVEAYFDSGRRVRHF